MRTKNLLIVLLTLVPAIASASGIWVAVRVLDHPEVVSEYHGKMESKAFWAFVQNKKTEGIFRLNKAFAVNQKGQPVRLPKLTIKNKSLGYGPDVFLRLEHVYRIIPLDEGYAKRHGR